MGTIAVLVVEDEVLIRKYITTMIQKYGGVVIGETALGEEAIDLVLRDHPDVVFMDIMLDGNIDGIEAARRISEFADTLIVFVSAYDYEESIKKEEMLNYFAFINKPVDRVKIKDVLDRIRDGDKLSSIS
ncbi:MAG TPA: response regulator [Spirochaetota bacterium]|nr:response regulator [Spirochaetota bacterium]HPI90037.1 response regulator [Spirochaetota bacterium]HPR48081.1 response regulator [Spirochaetota bacterium]